MKTSSLVGGAAAALSAAWLLKRAFRSRYSLRDKVVLITGGSRGLGLGLAREFAQSGSSVALVARDLTELSKAADDLRAHGVRDVSIWPCDVRDPAAIQTTVHAVAQEYGGLDVVVNNAGVIVVAPLEQLTVEDFDECLKMHFWAPYYVTMAALPFLKKRNESRVVNIASFGGKIAVPHLASYSATKFALVGLSDALRNELAQFGVKVTTVCPGLMRVGSHINAEFKGAADEEYTWFSLGMAMPFLSISGKRAARQIVSACQQGSAQLIVTVQAQVGVLAQALFPGLLASAMKLTNALLPKSPANITPLRKGSECGTVLSPSPFSILADQSSQRFNELGAA